MNRKYSISYFILLTAVILAFLFAYSITDSYVQPEVIIDDNVIPNENLYVDGEIKSESSTKDDTNTQSDSYTSGYLLYNENDYLVVYLYDGTTIFERTEIPIAAIPPSLHDELIHGKYIETLEELYGFLENYSS